MAAPDGVVCAVAVNNELAGIHPRSRATNGRAFEALQGPTRRAGVTGVFIAGEIGQSATHTYGANVPIETDNDAGQGAGALSPREQVSLPVRLRHDLGRCLACQPARWVIGRPHDRPYRRLLGRCTAIARSWRSAYRVLPTL